MNLVEQRQPVFDFYNAYEDPRFSLTAPLQVTDFRPYCRQNDISPFQFILFHLTKASLEVPHLRLRFDARGLYELDELKVSYTVLDSSQNVNFVTIPFVDDLGQFASDSEAEKQKVEASYGIDEALDGFDYLFVSALPWLEFSAVQHAYNGKEDSQIPRISFGKFNFDEPGKISIPLNVQCHHGLADGMHVSQYFAEVAKRIESQFE